MIAAVTAGGAITNATARWLSEVPASGRVRSWGQAASDPGAILQADQFGQLGQGDLEHTGAGDRLTRGSGNWSVAVMQDSR